MNGQFLLAAVDPCVERTYTDSKGQQQVFAERRFLLSDGLNTINAFATGDRARTTPLVQVGDFVSADLTFSASAWQTKDGDKRYETRVYLDRIALVWRR